MITMRMIEAAQEGDKAALEELWERTKKFALAVSRRYISESFADQDDFQQCAYLGFHTAVMTHTGRYSFLSLVQWLVQRECRLVLGLVGKPIFRAGSLDVELPDSDHTLEDTIEDESLPMIGEALEESELVRDVRAAVAELPERERLVVERHWLDGIALADIGECLGISAERVRQIECTAFEHLRCDPILRTYASSPDAYSARHSGMSAFLNSGTSSTEREAIRLISTSATRKPRKKGYAALLESLAATGFLTAEDCQQALSLWH